MSEHVATYVNYSIEDVAAQAREMYFAGWTVYQKWTCAHCASRQTMGEPNKFYRKGICEECGGETTITHCNYMAISGGKSHETL